MSVPSDSGATARTNRVSITLKVDVSWDGGELHGFTTDLWRGGLFVQTDEELALYTPVQVAFNVALRGEPRPVVYRGEVVRASAPDEARERGYIAGIGIVFDGAIRGGEAFDDFLELQAASSRVAAVDDQRHTPRVTVGLPVRFGPMDPPSRDGHLTSLSAGGAFLLETTDRVPRGSRLFLTFELPRGGAVTEVKAIATVVRMVGAGEGRQGGMGIEFDVSTVDPRTIARFVDERLAWDDTVEETARATRDDWPLREPAAPARVPPAGQPDAPPAPRSHVVFDASAAAGEAGSRRRSAEIKILAGALALLVLAVLVYLVLGRG